MRTQPHPILRCDTCPAFSRIVSTKSNGEVSGFDGLCRLDNPDVAFSPKSGNPMTVWPAVHVDDYCFNHPDAQWPGEDD